MPGGRHTVAPVQRTLDVIRRLVDEETIRVNDDGVRFGYFASPSGSLGRYLADISDGISATIDSHVKVLAEEGYLEPSHGRDGWGQLRWVVLDIDFQYREEMGTPPPSESAVNETLGILRYLVDPETTTTDEYGRAIAYISLPVGAFARYLEVYSRYAMATIEAHVATLVREGYLEPVLRGQGSSQANRWVILEGDFRHIE